MNNEEVWEELGKVRKSIRELASRVQALEHTHEIRKVNDVDIWERLHVVGQYLAGVARPQNAGDEKQVLRAVQEELGFLVQRLQIEIEGV